MRILAISVISSVASHRLQAGTLISCLYTLEANRFRKSWEVSLDELKEILSCDKEETYKAFKRFNDLILKKIHKEMHEKTECRYSYFPVKRGRSVKAIRFEVETLPKQYEAPEQLEMPEFTDSEPVFDVSQSEAERRDLYRDALAPYVVTDDQIDELVQLARKHIDARGHFTGSDLDQQIYNYLLSAKRHAKNKCARRNQKYLPVLAADHKKQ